MLTPYEIAAGKLCPAVRAMVARKLVKRHGLTQQQTARVLGLTQQAVSNYALGLRGLAEELGKVESVDNLSEEVVQAVLRGEDELTVTLMISKICDDMLSRRIICDELERESSCPLCNQKSRECIVDRWIGVRAKNAGVSIRPVGLAR